MLKKLYRPDRATCEVSFTIDRDASKGATTASLVGDFNCWDPEANVMTRRKDGSFETKLDLACGERHEFRYVLDGRIWENDAQADEYVPTPYGDADNSVVVTNAASEKCCADDDHGQRN